MTDRMAKRLLIYGIGIITMSIGLSLNVKSYLGVAPVLTVPTVLSEMTGMEFSNMLFLFYAGFILLQFVLKGKVRALDLIQFPIGLLITRIIALCTKLIPSSPQSSFIIKILILILAIIVTGIGVALSVNMKIAPNPADGLASAIGERFGIGLGMGKNILDITSVIVALIISLVRTHTPGPVGIGTVAAGLLVGRVIALFNKQFGERLAGLL